MIKRIITFTFLLTMVACIPAIAAEDDSEVVEEDQSGSSLIEESTSILKYVAGDTVNVRSGPSTEDPVVAQASRNDIVYVMSVIGDWSQVQYNDIDGYIRSDLLSDTETTAPPKKSYTDDDLYILAHVLCGECQSYPDEEQRYVGSVVLNRVASSKFPNNIHDVVFQKGQYACTWDGNYYRTPTQKNWDNARWLLENGSVLPSYVVYQSGSKLGKVYLKTKYHYYCY